MDKRIGDYCYPAIGQFKPSTKEAFEAQNKPKSIEKMECRKLYCSITR